MVMMMTIVKMLKMVMVWLFIENPSQSYGGVTICGHMASHGVTCHPTVGTREHAQNNKPQFYSYHLQYLATKNHVKPIKTCTTRLTFCSFTFSSLSESGKRQRSETERETETDRQKAGR